MTWIILGFISCVVVALIVYPLFGRSLEIYSNPQIPSAAFDERDAVLTALTEVEAEYELGRLSKTDYEHLKIYFQRKFLTLTPSPSP